MKVGHRIQVPFFLFTVVLAIQGCRVFSQEDSLEVDVVYQRKAVYIDYVDIYHDTVMADTPWVDTLGILENGYFWSFSPVETIWNCNTFGLQRHGDTVFLQSFTYSPPDSAWEIQFQCLDNRWDRFVLHSDGSSSYVGEHPLSHDPHVRLHQDTLRFDMTIVFLDRGAGVSGEYPNLIRWPQYGLLPNTAIDSLQQDIQQYEKGGPELVHGPKYRIDRQTWIYVHP